MRIVDLLRRLPAYWLSRHLGWPRPLPMNLTLSLTYRCNSRCATCNAWRREANELTAAEWEQVLRSIGRTPYWITVSGGEPLLRKDAVDIIGLACAHCQPAILNIPTNGLLTERIVRSVAAVTAAWPQTQVVVNLSLDGWGPDHDEIRGIPGNFDRAIETYWQLRALDTANLTVGIHTVISRLNAHTLPLLYTRIEEELAPDSYVSEIAEERVELGTVGMDITPSAESYEQAVGQLMTLQAHYPHSGVGRVTRAFRRRYYRLVQEWLRTRRQVIPCYAGWASGQISPDGEVWFCCVQAQAVGNLRQAGYDLRRVWWGEPAQALRAEIRARKCSCPLANAAYTNLLLHPPSWSAVLGDLLRGGDRR